MTARATVQRTARELRVVAGNCGVTIPAGEAAWIASLHLADGGRVSLAGYVAEYLAGRRRPRDRRTYADPTATNAIRNVAGATS